MRQNSHLPITGAAILLILLTIVFAVKMGQKNRLSDEIPVDLAQGTAFLQSLEAKDPTIVERTLKAQRQAEMQEKREERLQQLSSGELSVWSLFEDYLLLGDSRAVGFEHYNYLDDDRVLAEGGATIRHLADNIPTIVAENPAYLFLCYGLNDVSIGYWTTPDAYVEEFSETLTAIQSELPDITIIISSILIARDPAFERASAWYNIPEYSAAVEEMCSQIDGVYFVDNDVISEAHADMWNSDGIHISDQFYPYWATNLIMAVYDSENSIEETD